MAEAADHKRGSVLGKFCAVPGCDHNDYRAVCKPPWSSITYPQLNFMKATQTVEDILQLTFLHAFRDIAHFQQRTDATFGDWLARIAENRLCDALTQGRSPFRGPRHISGAAMASRGQVMVT